MNQQKPFGNGGLVGSEADRVKAYEDGQEEDREDCLSARTRRYREMTTAGRTLSNYEKETIINFNLDEAIAHIFTYNKTWQRHLEKRLGISPIKDNGFGGREYEIDKKRIPLPRAPRVSRMTPEQRKRAGERLSMSRLSSKTIIAAIKSRGEKSGKGNR